MSRLTAHSSTPGTARTAFSTRAEHAAQFIPVTENRRAPPLLESDIVLFMLPSALR